MTVLKVQGLSKVYGSEKNSAATWALENINFEVDQGEFLGVMGPSGSGKTTLLNLLASMDKPTTGHIEIAGVDLSKLKDEETAMFRRKNIGFVFQDFNLLYTLSVKENIILPLALDEVRPSDIEKRVSQVAENLGITHILDKRVFEISQGEQQRTAIARAIINRPKVVLADEPTGNLDSKSANGVMKTFSSLNEEYGITILMVTHDPFAASFCKRILFLKDGEIFSELRRSDGRQKFFQQVIDVLSVMGGTFDEPYQLNL
ncbi:MAG: ABC transporter ATP-binding protein [Bacillota bacterium]